jgi:hypothetical protein
MKLRCISVLFIDIIALFALPTQVSMFSFTCTSLLNLFQIPHPYRCNNSPITWYRPVPFLFIYIVSLARSIVTLYSVDLVSSCCIVQFYCMVALLCPPAWLHCSVLLHGCDVQSYCMVTVQYYILHSYTVQSYCMVTLFSSTT